MIVLSFRQNHHVQWDAATSPGDGQDGVDCPLGGGVCSHSAVPHHAANCDGLLEVRESSQPHSRGSILVC